MTTHPMSYWAGRSATRSLHLYRIHQYLHDELPMFTMSQSSSAFHPAPSVNHPIARPPSLTDARNSFGGGVVGASDRKFMPQLYNEPKTTNVEL